MKLTLGFNSSLYAKQTNSHSKKQYKQAVMYGISKRLFSTSSRLLFTKPVNKAFVFDIDGVIVRGATPIPRALETLQFLEKNEVPFCLLTNGGGYRELDRLKAVYDVIGFKPKNPNAFENKIVLSHTPFKEYVHQYKKVLVVGPSDSTKQVAQEYGFENVYNVKDIVQYNSSITPFSALPGLANFPEQYVKQLRTQDLDQTPFDAIFVFTDPKDWGADVQVINDLLNSDNGMLNTKRSSLQMSDKPSVPIFWAQKDLYWSNAYSLKRYGLGMFREIIKQTYKIDNNGAILQDKIFGKPMPIAYDYATKILLLKNKTKSNIYMVGDNPASDIIGAHEYGWNTCLVNTGVYSKGDPLLCKPTHIVKDLYEAVMKGLED